MGSRYNLSYKDFLELTPKQIDLMQLSASSAMAVENYNQKILHGFKNVPKPVTMTNQLPEEKELTNMEKIQFDMATSRILNGSATKRVQ